MRVLLTLVALAVVVTANADETETAAGNYIPPMRGVDPETAEGVKSRTVFGTDDRTQMLSTDYPWSAIGYLWLGGGHCTGTLVGRDLVLTNAHCVHDEDGRVLAPDEIAFYPNHRKGKPGIFSVARQIYLDNLGAGRGFYNEQSNYADWAIVRLNAPLGDEYGWLSIADTREIDEGVTLAGFSGDYYDGETAGIHRGCSIKEIRANGVVVHDCDTTAGSSGSALWRVRGDDYQIVALNSAESGDPSTGMRYAGAVEYSPSTAYNVAVRTAYFKDFVAELRNTEKGGDAFVTICNYNRSPARTALALPYEGDWVTLQATIAPWDCAEQQVSESGTAQVYLLDFNKPPAGGSAREFCISRDESAVERASGRCRGNSKAAFRPLRAHAGQLNVEFLAAGAAGAEQAPPARPEAPAEGGRGGRNDMPPRQGVEPDGPTRAELCNQSSERVAAAYAWAQDGAAITKGWRNLSPGDCTVVNLPEGYAGELAVHGETSTGYYGRDVQLCVDSVKQFEIRGAGKSCKGENRERVSFSVMRVFPGQQNTWNFR